jgi:hypothetical protein
MKVEKYSCPVHAREAYGMVNVEFQALLTLTGPMTS